MPGVAAAVLSTQPDRHDPAYDRAFEYPEFPEQVMEVVRQHGLLAHSDLPLPPLMALQMGQQPPPSILPGAMPSGLEMCLGAPGLDAPEGPLSRPTLLRPPPPQTPPPNVPPKVPMALPEGVLEAFPPPFESGPPGNLGISNAWKEIREMLDATKTTDPEAEAKANASAYLLSLVKGGSSPGQEVDGNSNAAGQKPLTAAMLLDEGILEAKMFDDGYRYVKVDGQWLGESSRYYCRHCSYWSNSMEAHVTTPHHQRNRVRGPIVVAPNNARRSSWSSETTKESSSSTAVAPSSRADSKVAGRSGWWEENIAKPAAARKLVEGPSSPPGPTPIPASKNDHTPVVQVDILRELLGKDIEDVRTGPSKPPTPWHLAWSQEHNAYYYWHGETREVQWEAPPLSG